MTEKRKISFLDFCFGNFSSQLLRMFKLKHFKHQLEEALFVKSSLEVVTKFPSLGKINLMTFMSPFVEGLIRFSFFSRGRLLQSRDDGEKKVTKRKKQAHCYSYKQDERRRSRIHLSIRNIFSKYRNFSTFQGCRRVIILGFRTRTLPYSHRIKLFLYLHRNEASCVERCGTRDYIEGRPRRKGFIT